MPHTHDVRIVVTSDYSPNKCEAPTFARKAIARDVNIADFTTTLEYASKILRRCPVCKIVDFQRDHPIDTRRRSTITHFHEFVFYDWAGKIFNWRIFCKSIILSKDYKTSMLRGPATRKWRMLHFSELKRFTTYNDTRY